MEIFILAVPVRIHIINVGSVTNKGTHALLKAEVSVINRIYPWPEISISTSDSEALRRLEPAFKICHPLIDIPFERADLMAIRNKKSRESLSYKFYLISFTILMLLQVILSLTSSIIVKVGLIERFRDSDLIISTADENFKEGSLYFGLTVAWKLAWWTILFSRTWDIIIAKKIFKKPIIVFPNSVGPFRTHLGGSITKTALNNVDFILLREFTSNKFLSDLKVTTPVANTTDVAVLLERNRDQPKFFAPTLRRQIIGVSPGLYAGSISKEKQMEYLSAHSRVLDQMIEQHGVDVLFLPLEITGMEGDDYSFCRLILQGMKHQEKVKMIKVETAELFKSHLARLDLLISSRMHPLVLASSEMVPTVVVCYDHKQSGFSRQLGLSDCKIDINDFSSEKLLSTTEFVWNNKERIRVHLAGVIPVLQDDVMMKIQKVCLNFLPFRN
jgi:colanic acid/amylovoran biosynthesis protein